VLQPRTKKGALVLVAWLAATCAACANDKVDAELGARCTSAGDCTDRCLPPGPDFPGGMCSRDCNADSECPSDTICAPIESGVCLYSCRDDGDCHFLGSVGGIEWTCRTASSGTGSGVKVCLGPGATP
jgi:hypothetical protein